MAKEVRSTIQSEYDFIVVPVSYLSLTYPQLKPSQDLFTSLQVESPVRETNPLEALSSWLEARPLPLVDLLY